MTRSGSDSTDEDSNDDYAIGRVVTNPGNREG